jgi:capsular polysaccharide export protein
MKKVLVIEPFYTNFHIDLAKYLSKDIYALIFNLGNIIYLDGAKKIFVHKKIKEYKYTDKDLQLAKNTKTLYTETLRKIENQEPSKDDFIYMARYISFARDYLIKNKMDLVMMHNDLRWQHALTISLCKELNIKYLVTERGIFRPDTTTVDFQGVNGYSSVQKDINFYKNLNIKEETLRSYKISKWINLKTNIKFTLFILLNKLGDLLILNSKIKNKNYSLIHYIKLFIKQKFLSKKDENIDLPKKFIFIPLQVNTDTQILIHSNFKNMQEFITLVEKTFYNINSDLKLVFKIHHMEKGTNSYKFNDKSIVLDYNTNELVEKSEFVITINSTVGFEALQKYKQVIVLGEAFFKIEKIVICSSKQNFLNDLKNTIENKKNIYKYIINNFVNYLKYKYQINGNLFNYDNLTFKQIEKRVIE